MRRHPAVVAWVVVAAALGVIPSPVAPLPPTVAQAAGAGDRPATLPSSSPFAGFRQAAPQLSPASPLALSAFSTTAKPGSAAAVAIAFALAQRGLPYVWGGNGPQAGHAGFDCSGLTTAAYAAAGVKLPRTAHTQYYAGPHVPSGAPLEPGDLVFYGVPQRVHHVGLYLGNNRMVNAPTFGKPVRLAYVRYAGDDYLGATRPAAGRDAPGLLGTGQLPVRVPPQPVHDGLPPAPTEFPAPPAPDDGTAAPPAQQPGGAQGERSAPVPGPGAPPPSGSPGPGSPGPGAPPPSTPPPSSTPPPAPKLPPPPLPLPAPPALLGTSAKAESAPAAEPAAPTGLALPGGTSLGLVRAARDADGLPAAPAGTRTGALLWRPGGGEVWTAAVGLHPDLDVGGLREGAAAVLTGPGGARHELTVRSRRTMSPQAAAEVARTVSGGPRLVLLRTDRATGQVLVVVAR